jgi:hypothetical protein
MEPFVIEARVAERWGGRQRQVQIVPQNADAYLAWRNRVGLGGNLHWKGPHLLVTVSTAEFVRRCEIIERVRYTVRRVGRQMRGIDLQPIA